MYQFIVFVLTNVELNMGKIVFADAFFQSDEWTQPETENRMSEFFEDHEDQRKR